MINFETRYLPEYLSSVLAGPCKLMLCRPSRNRPNYGAKEKRERSPCVITMGLVPSVGKVVLEQQPAGSPASSSPESASTNVSAQSDNQSGKQESVPNAPTVQRRSIRTSSIRRESGVKKSSRRQPISLTFVSTGNYNADFPPAAPSPTTQRARGRGQGGTSTTLRKEGVFALRNKGLERVPDEILFFSNLHTIYLDNNKLANLPAELASLRSLTALSIANNSLSGLPDELWRHPSLTFLNLSRNKFTTLPETIENSQGLQFLFLDKNQILSSPVGLSKLTALKIFSFKDNFLIDPPPLPVICPPYGHDSGNRFLYIIRS